MEDIHIIDLYFERSEDAIKATSEKYGAYCYRVAYGILHSREDAEECVNDAYLGAWNSIPPARPNCLQAFIGRIVRCSAINRLRYKTAEKRGGGEAAIAISELGDCIPDCTSNDAGHGESELSEKINAFLAGLSAIERKIFVRRYWYLDPIELICRESGFSENKVKMMLYRLRKRLKAHLGRGYFNND